MTRTEREREGGTGYTETRAHRGGRVAFHASRIADALDYISIMVIVNLSGAGEEEGVVDSPREIALISITTFTAVRQFRYRFIGDHVTQIRAPYPCAPSPACTRYGGRCEVRARARSYRSLRVYVYVPPRVSTVRFS